MICPDCKHQNLSGALFCSMCGRSLSGPGAPPIPGPAVPVPAPPIFSRYQTDAGGSRFNKAMPRLKKGMAIASLVIGIVSILTLSCAMIGAIFGIVLGVLAHSKATKEPLEYGGKRIAVAGIITSAASIPIAGVLGIIAAIALPNMSRARAAINEVSVIARLERVSSAEYRFHDSAKKYGTLQELQSAGLLDSSDPIPGGYKFDLRVTSKSFEVLATPQQSVMRQKSFYVTTDYVVRAAYKNGGEANVHDLPIYH
jgi:hypothetical protein